MFDQKKYIRLGIFVFIGTILFIVAVFSIGDKQSMFSQTYSVRVFFSNIEGLREGAPVRYSGIIVGSVQSIKIVPDTSGRVEVKIVLDNSIAKLIRLNTEALIETEGLVGNKVVNLRGGSQDSPQAKEGDKIVAIEPLGLAVIVNDIRTVLANTDRMTKSLADIVEKANSGEGSIGKFINDPSLYNSTTSLMIETEKGLKGVSGTVDSLRAAVGVLTKGSNNLLTNIDGVIVRVDDLLKDVQEGKGIAGALISGNGESSTSINEMLTNFNDISKELKLASGRLAENMEALKHNWLFKSYFEQRGFYDKTGTEVSIDDKMGEVNKRIEMLDAKIKELKALENK